MILTKFNKIKRRKIIRRWSIGFVSSSIVILTVIALRNHLAQASPLAGFDPGNIMSDSVMSDYQTMTVEQIQNFLNQKMPHCDTYGRKNVTYFYQPSTGRLSFSWFAGAQRVTTTRAVFGERNNKWRNGTDYGVPFTCLRDKVEHGKTAARIIYDVAHKYKINPQVLIVLLQKEQNLVHDDWPQGIQYRTATGYGCPDTAPCAKEYFGLTNQLDWAAKMFRSILNRSSGWYTPYGVGNNRIYWSPNHGCGYSTVNIQNLATAALYSYTPYRPNQAALSAGYGLGDSCSAYGNRNFYLYFKDWFGASHAGVNLISSLQFKDIKGKDLSVPAADEDFYAVFKIKNYTNRDVNLGKIAMIVRNESEQNYDFGVVDVVLKPNAEYEYRQKTRLPEGKYSFWIGNYNQQHGWNDSYPESKNNQLIRKRAMPIAKTLIANSINYDKIVHQGDDNIIEAEIFNPNIKTEEEFYLRAVAIGDNKTIVSPSSYKIRPGHTQKIQFPISTNQVKTEKYAIKYQSNNGEHIRQIKTSTNQPLDITFDVKPAIVVSQGVTAQYSAVGDSVTGIFKIKNLSSKAQTLAERYCYILRGPAGQNLDLGCLEKQTIQPKQELTFSHSFIANYQGKYKATIRKQTTDGNWYPLSPEMLLTTNQPLDITFDVKPAIRQ